MEDKGRTTNVCERHCAVRRAGLSVILKDAFCENVLICFTARASEKIITTLISVHKPNVTLEAN